MTLATVLMVDDNRGDVMLLQEALQSAGLLYNLSVAQDGVEALDFLRRKGRHAAVSKPDLIVLDLKLPRKTGMEVLDEIKLDPGLRDIPLVVLSSSRSELCIARSRKAPSYTCLVKPSTFEGYVELAWAIEAVRKTTPGGESS